jgi:hypothetical protein
VDPSNASDLVPLGHDTASVVGRTIVFLLVLALSFVAAFGFWNALRGSWPGALVRRVMGRPPMKPWATGEWACGRCHTVNRGSQLACQRCRAPRESVQMSFAGIPTEPDVIPSSVPAGAGATVTLEHNESAHLDGLNGHWRLRVNSVIVGSAARRDGALALLHAVEGADAVLFDRTGSGYAPYSLGALIAAFEQPRLPINGPCPERAR